jgi:hypothetical protein
VHKNYRDLVRIIGLQQIETPSFLVFFRVHHGLDAQEPRVGVISKRSSEISAQRPLHTGDLNHLSFGRIIEAESSATKATGLGTGFGEIDRRCNRDREADARKEVFPGIRRFMHSH